MQESINLINEAAKEAKIAEYVLDVTSRLVKDKKIVISTLMHLKKSLNLSFKSYLISQKEKGKIKSIFSDEELIFNYFMETSKSKFLSSDDEKIICTILNSLKSYDYRGMILEKNNAYTFISEDYNLITFSDDELRKFIKRVNAFVKIVEADING